MRDVKRDIADQLADAADLLDSIGGLDRFPSLSHPEPERSMLLLRLERLKQSLAHAERALSRGQG